ncbi:hypothetical protein [Saccharothrix sp.]|uniref:hypothetical protein n=1 Tax=Saccharothrix sp. TaxID=1873460 RepID=UPI002812352D|nr:hypothetical protein [Saccharothrix sp.]
MTAFVRSRAPHWVLVWTVVFAVIGMHHLSTRAEHGLGTHAEHGHAPAATACCTHGTPEEPAPNDHDALHLCLAVLGAALALAALALIAFRDRKTAERLGTLLARVVHSPPGPRGAPALLATLCVLRL